MSLFQTTDVSGLMIVSYDNDGDGQKSLIFMFESTIFKHQILQVTAVIFYWYLRNAETMKK